MLEALACGVIVLVWDVACISSVYGDNVVKITVPEKITKNYNPRARFASCRWMLTDEAKKLFVDKIIELESNPQLKEEIRQKGISWAKDISWDRLGAQMEENLEINLYT
jgi:glycosyltransferase involved in cell wall biosynthesis